MTYSKNPSSFEGSQELYQELTQLEPGTSISITYSSREVASRRRMQIYSWLNFTRLKNKFRLYWPEPNKLRIKRLEEERGILEKEAIPSNSRVESVLSEMIQATDETEAIRIAREKKNEGVITPGELGVLICSYEELMR